MKLIDSFLFMNTAQSRMQQDGEDLDYTLFAGVTHPRAAVLPLQLSISRTNLASTSKLPQTPTPARSKRSLATWLANQILEEDEVSTGSDGDERSVENTIEGESIVTFGEATPLNAQVRIVLIRILHPQMT